MNHGITLCNLFEMATKRKNVGVDVQILFLYWNK
mgnify:CR=1 FL=1